MLNCIAVGMGGFVGAVCRYWMGLLPIRNPHGFPVSTLLVNIIGAFVIGCSVAWAAKDAKLDPRLILETFTWFTLSTSWTLRTSSTSWTCCTGSTLYTICNHSL